MNTEATNILSDRKVTKGNSMKKYTILREVPFAQGYVVQDEGNDNGLFVLSDFLYSELISRFSYDFITSWLKDEINYSGIAGHIYQIDEVDSKIIISQQEVVNNINLTFTTTKVKLLEHIHEWMRTIYKKDSPLEVMLTQDDDGKIHFKWVGKMEKEKP